MHAMTRPCRYSKCSYNHQLSRLNVSDQLRIVGQVTMRCGLAHLRLEFASFRKEMKIFGRLVRCFSGWCWYHLSGSASSEGYHQRPDQNLRSCSTGVPFDGRSTPPDPPSWSNNGTGGIRVHSNGTCVAYTGHRAMPASGSLVFRFSLMVTPTRPLNLTKHWGERYFQAGGPVDYHAVAEGGATVLNSESSLMLLKSLAATSVSYCSVTATQRCLI